MLREPCARHGAGRSSRSAAARSSHGQRVGGALLTIGLLVGALPLASAVSPDGAPPGPFAGRPLTDALLDLQAQGLRLVFSSRVVRPEMRVLAEPSSQDLRAVLAELLAPHGLTVREGQAGSLVVVASGEPPPPASLRGSVLSRRALAPVSGVAVSVLDTGLEATTDTHGRFAIDGLDAGTYTVQARRPGFVVEQRAGVPVMPGAEVNLSFVLQPAPLTADEIAVHPSRISLLHEEPSAPLALSREEILDLPQLGGDVFRALNLLPGATSNDITAQFHVRGGRRDEVMVLLDGQELYEAYHLKDFDNALSIVPASGLANLDLTTGAFPSSYGDRLGGILEMSSLAPAKPRELRVSASVFSAQLEGSGVLNERWGWMASARRGATDLAGRVFGQEDPSFWDLLGKLNVRPSDRQSLRLNTLRSADRLDFIEDVSGERRGLHTDYDSGYLWLTHQGVLHDRLFVDTAVSTSRIDRDRRGFEDEEEKRFDVRDERDLDVQGLLQAWNLQASQRHFLKLGFELRRFQAGYDYFSDRLFESPMAALRAEPREGVFAFLGDLEDDYATAYVSDRWRPVTALTLELGLRYDHHSLTDDAVWSPRATLAWALGGSSVLRLGWGRYHQSQRAYELMVEDGDTRLYPAERSEDWVVGFEHLIESGAGGPLSALRAEVYRRRVVNPRPRYENLFEPFEPFPEGELDRFRFDPDNGVATGLELFLHGRSGQRLRWWLNYAFATTEDELGGEEIRRQIDQRHTLNVNLNRRFGRHWQLNLAWRVRSGRPTTAISVAEGPGGDPVPVLGPINGERLPAYHRLDIRASRDWPLGSGRLTLFFDIQNLYHRRNTAGFDVEIDSESGEIDTAAELWPGFFPSAGISWSF